MYFFQTTVFQLPWSIQKKQRTQLKPGPLLMFRYHPFSWDKGTGFVGGLSDLSDMPCQKGVARYSMMGLTPIRNPHWAASMPRPCTGEGCTRFYNFVYAYTGSVKALAGFQKLFTVRWMVLILQDPQILPLPIWHCCKKLDVSHN